jgi:hypothetical protein
MRIQISCISVAMTHLQVGVEDPDEVMRALREPK